MSKTEYFAVAFFSLSLAAANVLGPHRLVRMFAPDGTFIVRRAVAAAREGHAETSPRPAAAIASRKPRPALARKPMPRPVVYLPATPAR